MRDRIDIGPTPAEEECQQLGHPDYDPAKAKAECRRFIDLIRRTLGEEPPGARLAVVSNAHDFGTYYEVACLFDDENQKATDYAYRCESNAPITWGPEPPVELPPSPFTVGAVLDFKRRSRSV